ncbi:MAG: hypothetical protein U0V70_06655 [Terriglobia bacterium]
MIHKSYFYVTGLIFLVFALAHLFRLVLGLPVQINAWSVPVWVSGIAFGGGVILAIWGFQLSKSR